jgi:hypothetical protein
MIRPILVAALATFLLVAFPSLVLGASISVLFFDSTLTFGQILAVWGIIGSIVLLIGQSMVVRKAFR